MRVRWGLGPVFRYESLLSARRWRNYAGRSAFVLVLLAGMSGIWMYYSSSFTRPRGVRPSYRLMAEIGMGFFYALTFGFLILAATAPTKLAEERIQGSLDVLLVTPLATRKVVLAKWWGVFRPVLMMLPLFLYVASFDAAVVASRSSMFAAPAGPEPVTSATRLFAATFCPAGFLATGALVVSIGLALANWSRWVGRAIALSVIVFFLLGMVWPTVVEIGFALLMVRFDRRGSTQWMDQYRWVSQTIGALSPVGGPILPLNTLHWNYGGGSGFRIGVGLVVLFKVVLAWLLFELTVRTFDRCLGRVSESPHRAVRQSASPQTLGDWNPSGRGRAFGGAASRAKAS
jgi:hypothetical protein